jgi:hypothetical protein
MFSRRDKEKEDKEAKALEKIMMEVLKAEERKEKKIEDLARLLEDQFKDFPMHKLLHLLVRKNVLQLKDLEDLKKS